MISHMNCMLVCKAGEMMKICTGCTWLLERICLGYMAPLEGCTWVHRFSPFQLGTGMHH